MSLSIRLTEQEQRLANSYARIHSISVEEAFKRALFDKIEDEYDAEIANVAYKEYLNNPKTYSHNEVKEFLDL